MSITDSGTPLDTAWTEQSVVAFTSGVLSTIANCVSEVEAKLKRGTLSASTQPTQIQVYSWLKRAKLELAEVKDFTFKRKYAYATLTAGDYRVSLPPDYDGGLIADQIAAKKVIEPRNRDYEVEIVLSDGKPYPYKGRINFADPSFSQVTGSFLVRAVLPNPKGQLRPGMFVTAIVHGAMRPKAIVLPPLANQQGSDGHLVYVINANGVAEIRPVIVGDYVGEKDIVVVGGLHAGDRVVVDGVLKVVPGQPVTVVPPGTPPADAAGKAAAPAAPKK